MCPNFLYHIYSLEEMNIADFLEQLKSLNLDGTEKENELLSQHKNKKRISTLNCTKVPFG
jgi:hypothetical protein